MLSPRLLLFCVLLTACGKESVSVSGFQELPNPIAEDLSSIAFSDSLRGTITGGTAWKSGFFLNTYDGGLTWKTDTVLDRKMEHVCFDVNGQGYAGGQDGLWYRPAGAERWRVFRIDYQWIRACHFPMENGGPWSAEKGITVDLRTLLVRIHSGLRIPYRLSPMKFNPFGIQIQTRSMPWALAGSCAPRMQDGPGSV